MKGALQLVYPPQCMACGDTVTEAGALCPACWGDADFINGTCCDLCGAPLPGEGGDTLHCDDCMAVPRPWEQARAALTYRGTGRKLTLALKHGDRLDTASPLGDWVAQAALPLIREGMVVAPVPLHLRRLLRRHYNQAELLARRVARAHGLPCLTHLLIRRRHTPAQDNRSFQDRFANLDDALTVRPRLLPALAGRPVLLVDDVMASGATLTVAAEALRAGGAASISVVVLARAVKDT